MKFAVRYISLFWLILLPIIVFFKSSFLDFLGVDADTDLEVVLGLWAVFGLITVGPLFNAWQRQEREQDKSGAT